MAQLRFRFRFNPGRTGAPLDKLGEFAVRTERFLRSLACDLDLPMEKGKWLAVNFTNESVAFDSEFAEAVPEKAAARGKKALELLTGDTPLDACDRKIIEFKTAAEFSQIGQILDPHEQFMVGIYEADAKPEWRPVTYQKVAELRKLLTTPIISYGSVQGIIHAWAMGADQPFLQLRDLASGDLVRCNYKQELRAKIVAAAEHDRVVIHVYGKIKWDRTKNKVLEVAVDDIEVTSPLAVRDFDKLFGSMPRFTGGMNGGADGRASKRIAHEAARQSIVVLSN
ncbi:MAG: hypothetical protein ACLPX9_06490 [Rhodomicrobium sp.]